MSKKKEYIELLKYKHARVTEDLKSELADIKSKLADFERIADNLPRCKCSANTPVSERVITFASPYERQGKCKACGKEYTLAPVQG